MQKLSEDIVQALLKQNDNIVYIIVNNDTIVRTPEIAGFIGFEEGALRKDLSLLKNTYTNLQNLQIAKIDNVEAPYDLRFLFSIQTPNGMKEYKKLLISGYGYMQSEDIYKINQVAINIAVEELKNCQDNSQLYTVFNADRTLYKINNRQPIYFDREEAKLEATRIGGNIFGAGEIVAPVFLNAISNYGEFIYKNMPISGYDINTACKIRFEASCLSINEISELLQRPLKIFKSIDGENYVLQHYYQPLLFTSDDELAQYDKREMSRKAAGVNIIRDWYPILFDKEYIFFDGKTHCKIQDFYLASL